MEQLLLPIATAILVFIFAQIAFQLAATKEKARVDRMKTLVDNYAAGEPGLAQIRIRRRRRLSNNQALADAISILPYSARLELLVERSGTRLTVASLLSLCVLSIGFALAALAFFLPGVELAVRVLIALACGMLPVAVLNAKRRKRLALFERQMPDALDLVARSLLAGHALSTGLAMIADECDDPIGTEFKKLADEIRLGLSMDEALANLCERVESQDLRFFMVSVNIQRETGGNLAELLGLISRLIRERFKFERDVQTLTAEAKLSALILTVLPFFIAGYMNVINPGYLQTLLDAPEGRMMVYAALGGMVVGVYIMNRMTRIEV